jgi:hypothetical protein
MGNTILKSKMLNLIMKKMTGTNVSKSKLQAIADILNIQTKTDDSKFLSKIATDNKRDKETFSLEKEKTNIMMDDIKSKIKNKDKVKDKVPKDDRLGIGQWEPKSLRANKDFTWKDKIKIAKGQQSHLKHLKRSGQMSEEITRKGRDFWKGEYKYLTNQKIMASKVFSAGGKEDVPFSNYPKKQLIENLRVFDWFIPMSAKRDIIVDACLEIYNEHYKGKK